MTDFRIIVMLSGTGSNFQSLLEANLNANFVAVISDQILCEGLQRAKRNGIPTLSLEGRPKDWEQPLKQVLQKLNPDLIILAGFMQRIPAQICQAWFGKIINLHPALLPKYPGLQTHQRVLDAGDLEHGTTVHFVTATIDAGPILCQTSLPVSKGMTSALLEAKIKKLEHQMLPRAVQWFIERRINTKQEEIYFDGNVLPAQGIRLTFEASGHE